jgi:hypothetical protein
VYIAFDDLMAEARRRSDLTGLVRKHLFAGVPYVFRERPADYDLMKEYLSSELGIPATTITIVGSGRLGYSLNPSHPGMPMSEASDVDVIVTNETLFDQLWDLMLKWRYPWHMQYWSTAEQAWGTRHLENFIAGHSMPHLIRKARIGSPRHRRQLMDFSHKWFSVFKNTGRYSELAGRDFKGRLYRTWPFATRYHTYGLRRLSRQVALPPKEST